MIITPDITYIAYFKNKFKRKYYIIGEVTQIWSAIYPEPNKKLDVCFFLIKAYAGTGEYFRKQNIPLTAEKFRKAYPRNSISIFENTPVNLRKLNAYIRKCSKEHRDHFLFYVRCKLNSWKKRGRSHIFKPIDIHYALQPLVHKGPIFHRFEEPDPSLGYTQKISDFIRNHLWSTLAKEGNEIVMPYNAYLSYLHKIATLIYDFHGKEIITSNDINRLNNYNLPKNNPLEEFIYSFLYEFKQYLNRHKRLGVCPICEAVFPYKKKKICCSKGCLKSRSNTVYYGKYTRILRNRKRRATKSRRYLKQNRKLYNTAAIKK
jgi:hypothetical protein